jgi:Na+-translocating ferredoxin:NAD+ oxidoreductase RnfG subunit
MAFTGLRRRETLIALAAIVLTAVMSTGVSAALCVWRKPDQDIKKFFPGADTYKTDLKDPGSRKAAIEKRIGRKLDADEQEFKLYRVMDGGNQIGTIMTHLGKGQYGAIEIVVALDNNGRIKGVAIQRDREKKRAELRSERFLGQFNGKTVRDPLTVGKDIKPVPGAEKSSETVAVSVKKLLVIYDELG